MYTHGHLQAGNQLIQMGDSPCLQLAEHLQSNDRHMLP